MLKPFYQDAQITEYHGHILDVLRDMPAESVHCVVTSPPYWGLRDYGLEPQVWDYGGGLIKCRHEWNIKDHKDTRGVNDSNLTGRIPYTEGEARLNYKEGFCQKCNAWLGSLGLEPTPELYIQHLVQVFREVKRVLRKDGTVWLNIGDSYIATGGHKKAGKNGILDKASKGSADSRNIKSKPIPEGLKIKDLCMIPARVALALQADGWWLRSMMPWVKRSAMPESCDDRPASALEYVFLLSKSKDYYFDMEAVRVEHLGTGHIDYSKRYVHKNPKKKKSGDGHQYKECYVNPAGRNFRNTDLYYESIKPPHGMIFADEEPVGLDVNPQSFAGAHFATFAEALIMPLIKCSTSEKGCCPECGGGWVRVVEKGPLKEHPDRQNRTDRNKADFNGKDYAARDSTLGLLAESKTIGWKPSCECNRIFIRPEGRPKAKAPYQPIPCTLLDMFSGSGRTLIVAKKLGRKAIGIDLKENYLRMPLDKLAQERLF